RRLPKSHTHPQTSWKRKAAGSSGRNRIAGRAGEVVPAGPAERTQNLVKEPGANRLARVHWDERASAILMAQETMDCLLHVGDSGEGERIFRQDSERHSGMNPNTIGA